MKNNYRDNYLESLFIYFLYIVLIFSLVRAIFFYSFWFSLYKVVDSKYSTGEYKSSKISIVAVMKNLEMLKFDDKIKQNS